MSLKPTRWGPRIRLAKAMISLLSKKLGWLFERGFYVLAYGSWFGLGLKLLAYAMWSLED